MGKDNRPSSGVMRRLTDGSTVSHRSRRGVTGAVKIMNGDFHVEWSDKPGKFEVLDSYDIGRIH